MASPSPASRACLWTRRPRRRNQRHKRRHQRRHHEVMRIHRQMRQDLRGAVDRRGEVAVAAAAAAALGGEDAARAGGRTRGLRGLQGLRRRPGLPADHLQVQVVLLRCQDTLCPTRRRDHRRMGLVGRHLDMADIHQVPQVPRLGTNTHHHIDRPTIIHLQMPIRPTAIHHRALAIHRPTATRRTATRPMATAIHRPATIVVVRRPATGRRPRATATDRRRRDMGRRHMRGRPMGIHHQDILLRIIILRLEERDHLLPWGTDRPLGAIRRRDIPHRAATRPRAATARHTAVRRTPAGPADPAGRPWGLRADLRPGLKMAVSRGESRPSTASTALVSSIALQRLTNLVAMSSFTRDRWEMFPSAARSPSK